MSANAPAAKPAAARRSGSVRPLFLKIHRWLGLALAAFLIMSGLTGALLAFHDSIDASLNPRLFDVEPQGTRLSPLVLRERGEELLPHARIDAVYLDKGPRDAALMWLRPRVDPGTGQPYELPANQLFLNPYTGALLGQRNTDQMGLDREHLMETVFHLHRYLLLGDTGTKILVFIATAWFISTLIGFYLTLPPGAGAFSPAGSRHGACSGARRFRASASTCIARPACGCGSCCSPSLSARCASRSVISAGSMA